MKKGSMIFPVGRITVIPERNGVSIEEEMRKAIRGGEPVEATAKITYADRKLGVLPENDVRTDRFEYAMLATDKLHASAAAKRHDMDFPKEDMKELAQEHGGEA